jgi:hypothetical protein
VIALSFETVVGGERGARPLPLVDAVIAGWTGRDTVALEHHIAELEKLGVPRPREVPAFYRVGVELLTLAPSVQVVGPHSSGEVEAFVLRAGGAWWVGVGSDHTDRRLERVSVALSKQVCPKPLARELWPLAEVRDHWAQLETRSWRVEGGRRELYQQGSLAGNREPAELIALYERRHGEFADGTLMLCGTLPAIGGIRPAGRFELELADPVRGRRIGHGYDIVALPADLPED